MGGSNLAEASSTPAKPLIESDRVEGTTVYGAGGERIGTIKRLMVEKVSRRVAYAAIEFGLWEIGADDHTIHRCWSVDRMLRATLNDLRDDMMKRLVILAALYVIPTAQAFSQSKPTRLVVS